MTPRPPPQPPDRVNPVLTSEGWPAPRHRETQQGISEAGVQRATRVRAPVFGEHLSSDIQLRPRQSKKKKKKKKYTLSKEEIFGCRIWIQCFLTSLDMPLGGMGVERSCESLRGFDNIIFD